MPTLPDLDALAPPTLVAVAVGLVLFQTAFVVGFLVPGGKAAILSGVMAGLGHVALPLVYAGILSASVLGAGVGYLLGRRYGDRLFEIRLLRRHRDRIDKAQDLLRRRVAVALLVGRSIAVLRATTPALAGASGVQPRTFLLWNVVGGVGWSAVFVGAGYIGGVAVPSVAESAPRFALILGTAVLVGFVLVGTVKGRLARSQ